MIFDEPLITSTLVLGLIVFACAFGGALLGLLLRVVLPEHHLRTESKDVVKLGMGLIATMSALVLSGCGPRAMLERRSSRRRSVPSVYDEIQALAPRDEAQRSLKAEALRIGLEIGRAVVAARAEGQLDPLAVHGGADLLARDDLHELRHLRTGQHDRHRDAAHLRIVDFRRDVPDPGA